MTFRHHPTVHDHAGPSFAAAHVAPNQVIVLTGGTSGCYPIVSVDSPTQLTISVLWDGLMPISGDPTPSPIGTTVDLAFVVRTFWPQRRVVSELLLQAAGLLADDATGRAELECALQRFLDDLCESVTP